jgi:hypothetical protein
MDGGDASVPIQFIQIAGLFCASKSSCAATFQSPVQAGSAILVITSAWKNMNVSVSDTLKNVFAQYVGPADDPQFRNLMSASFNSPAGADIVTVTAGNSTDLYIWAAEYKGVYSFDVGAFTVGNGTACNSGNLMSTHANDLLFGYAGYWAGGTTDQLYTTRLSSNNVLIQDRIVNMTGSYNLKGTQNSSNNWAFIVGAFKGQ